MTSGIEVLGASDPRAKAILNAVNFRDTESCRQCAYYRYRYAHDYCVFSEDSGIAISIDPSGICDKWKGVRL